MFLLVCTNCMNAPRVHPQDGKKVTVDKSGIKLTSDFKCPGCQRQYLAGQSMYGIKIIPPEEVGIMGDVTDSCIVVGNENVTNGIKVNYEDGQPTSLTVNGCPVSIMSAYWL